MLDWLTQFRENCPEFAAFPASRHLRICAPAVPLGHIALTTWGTVIVALIARQGCAAA